MYGNSINSSEGAFAPNQVLSGFNKRLISAILLAGPLFQAIEFILENPSNDNAERIASWSTHLARVGVSMASGMLAIPFLLGGITILVSLTRPTSTRLAWLAGILMMMAMVGLAAAHGYELAAYGLARMGNTAGALSVLNAEDLGIPGFLLLIMFLGGAVTGSVTLAIAEWRSPFIPRLVVFFLLAFAVLDFAVGTGMISHLVALGGNIILVTALLNGYHRKTSKAMTVVPQQND